jgi:hypothetical protein
MPAHIHHLLFERDFNDLPSPQLTTAAAVGVTDVERRAAFVKEINIILSKQSRKNQHLLPSIILQLIRLRFPTDLDNYKPSNFGIDVTIQKFVQWTINIK